jgi:hypothetical protein
MQLARREGPVDAGQVRPLHDLLAQVALRNRRASPGMNRALSPHGCFVAVQGGGEPTAIRTAPARGRLARQARAGRVRKEPRRNVWQAGTARRTGQAERNDGRGADLQLRSSRPHVARAVVVTRRPGPPGTKAVRRLQVLLCPCRDRGCCAGISCAGGHGILGWANAVVDHVNTPCKGARYRPSHPAAPCISKGVPNSEAAGAGAQPYGDGSRPGAGRLEAAGHRAAGHRVQRRGLAAAPRSLTTRHLASPLCNLGLDAGTPTGARPVAR